MSVSVLRRVQEEVSSEGDAEITMLRSISREELHELFPVRLGDTYLRFRRKAEEEEEFPSQEGGRKGKGRLLVEIHQELVGEGRSSCLPNGARLGETAHFTVDDLTHDGRRTLLEGDGDVRISHQFPVPMVPRRGSVVVVGFEAQPSAAGEHLFP